VTFHRFVALGDSFTEGVGDPDPDYPNGLRGWADRVAEVLATKTDDFGYANLAIRGRKLGPIVEEQVDTAIALQPDLVTIHAGGNDVLRPRVDVDALAVTYDAAIARLKETGARVVMFTVYDPGPGGIYGPIRGRMAIFNEWVREIADRHDVTLVDMWRMRDVDIDGAMDDDRMHLNHFGHTYIAREVLQAIGVEHDIPPVVVTPRPLLDRRGQWAANVQWTRDFLVPWVQRRVTGRSSGDTVSPKRPGLSEVSHPVR
jgi:lysophospholipase L1-like esterase